MVILSVPGIALQAAAAREVALGRLGHGRQLAAAVASWGRHLAIAFVVLSVAAVLLRHQLAAIMSVDQEWAAAATVPIATVWLFLSLVRGVLSGLHAYKPVGLSIRIMTWIRSPIAVSSPRTTTLASSFAATARHASTGSSGPLR